MPIPSPAPSAATPMVSPPENIRKAPSGLKVGVMANRERSPTTNPYIASASARIVAIRFLDTVSGLSVPAPAIAGAEILIPRAAPSTERSRLRLTPSPANNIVSATTCLYYPALWFPVGREWQSVPLIKLAKPLDPVKPQSLNEYDQALDNHD